MRSTILFRDENASVLRVHAVEVNGGTAVRARKCAGPCFLICADTMQSWFRFPLDPKNGPCPAVVHAGSVALCCGCRTCCQRAVPLHQCSALSKLHCAASVSVLHGLVCSHLCGASLHGSHHRKRAGARLPPVAVVVHACSPVLGWFRCWSGRYLQTETVHGKRRPADSGLGTHSCASRMTRSLLHSTTLHHKQKMSVLLLPIGGINRYPPRALSRTLIDALQRTGTYNSKVMKKGADAAV